MATSNSTPRVNRKVASHFASKGVSGRVARSDDARTPDVLHHLGLGTCLIDQAMRSIAPVVGAGEGNRTLVISLEGCCSTIELHPRTATHVARLRRGNLRRMKAGVPTEAAQRRRLVGEVGLEPTKA